jgi:hypothetical protein
MIEIQQMMSKRRHHDMISDWHAGTVSFSTCTYKEGPDTVIEFVYCTGVSLSGPLPTIHVYSEDHCMTGNM